MAAVASAPGKLVLLGEYAVLEGAPALVMAVDRRAAAVAWRSDDPPTRGWLATRDPALLRIVAALRANAPADGIAVRVRTGALFGGPAGGRVKLGLGSSAALTVALAGALAALGGEPAPRLGDLVRVHRDGQGGQGSGVDLAAALHGGLSVYRLGADGPHAVPAVLPPGLHWCCVWTGRPASTGDRLHVLDAWRRREPHAHARGVAALAEVAARGADAALRADAAALVAAADAYAARLREFGAASGIDIVSHEHAALRTLARASGVAWKSCGAGGGDVGIALALDPAALARFRTRAAQAGFTPLDLALDPHGLVARAAHASPRLANAMEIA